MERDPRAADSESCQQNDRNLKGRKERQERLRSKESFTIPKGKGEEGESSTKERSRYFLEVKLR